eukprot:Seg460.17 transcript_id=Seg460.17/GoldUCD/mRNA.D3Y31 product="hypothetical protein" protein_id=Seg460.17/GoldUCD/D3Y31
MADKFSKFPSIGRIKISDSYSSNSTDEERKIFRNAETGSTDSDGRLSVVPISASNCSVLARALRQVDIRNQRQDSSASQQGVQATENSEVLAHPASSSSNDNSLMEVDIRDADTVSEYEEEQVQIYQRNQEQRWVRRRAASESGGHRLDLVVTN